MFITSSPGSLSTKQRTDKSPTTAALSVEDELTTPKMGMQLLQQSTTTRQTSSLSSHSSIGSSDSSSRLSPLNVSSRSASPQDQIILESKAALSFELDIIGVEAEIKRIKEDIAKMDVMPVPSIEGRSRLEDELKAAEDKLAELQLQIAVEQGMARAKAMSAYDTQTVTTADGSTIAGDCLTDLNGDNISLYSKSSRARNHRRGGGGHHPNYRVGHGHEDYETGSVASRHSIASKSIAGSVAYTIDSRYREQMSVKSNMSVEEFRFNMDREHALNTDLMKKLAKKMAKHITKSSERKALKSHWEYKSTRYVFFFFLLAHTFHNNFAYRPLPFSWTLIQVTYAMYEV